MAHVLFHVRPLGPLHKPAVSEAPCPKLNLATACRPEVTSSTKSLLYSPRLDEYSEENTEFTLIIGYIKNHHLFLLDFYPYYFAPLHVLLRKGGMRKHLYCTSSTLILSPNPLLIWLLPTLPCSCFPKNPSKLQITKPVLWFQPPPYLISAWHVAVLNHSSPAPTLSLPSFQSVLLLFLCILS